MDAFDLKLLLESVEENSKYEEYLTEHIGNVKKGYQWLKDNLPAVIDQDNYIEENYNQDISLKELSDLLNLSEYYFCRL